MPWGTVTLRPGVTRLFDSTIFLGSLENEIDGLLCNPKMVANLTKRHAVVSHYLGFKRVNFRLVVVGKPRHSAKRCCVGIIACRRGPFEVLNAVVSAICIFVVDNLSAFWWPDECRSNQAVNSNRCFDSITVENDRLISIAAHGLQYTCSNADSSTVADFKQARPWLYWNFSPPLSDPYRMRAFGPLLIVAHCVFPFMLTEGVY